MRSADSYAEELRAFLPMRAFLRIDRLTEAVFVSDAPRFEGSRISEIPGYAVVNDSALLRITPLFEDAPESVRAALPALLKTDGAARDAAIRKNLAVALRMHDAQSADYWKELLDEEEKRI